MVSYVTLTDGPTVGNCELDGPGSIYSTSDGILQECCEVIEQTVEQDYIAVWGGKPQVVDYEWDPLISKVGWFSSLTSQISPQGPVV